MFVQTFSHFMHIMPRNFKISDSLFHTVIFEIGKEVLYFC